MLDEFDTLRQHAEWLKKSPRTVQRWIARPNGLPYARAGKELLFKPRWTLEWLESLKTQRNPAPQTRRGRPRKVA